MAKRKPLISALNEVKRMSWCLDLVPHLPVEWYRHILWTDEALILACNPGYIHVRRPKLEEDNPVYFVPTIKFGRFSCMVWAGVYWGGRTKIHIWKPGTKIDADEYCHMLWEEKIYLFC